MQRELQRYLSSCLVLFISCVMKVPVKEFNPTLIVKEILRTLDFLNHLFGWRVHDCYHPSEVMAV